MELTVEQVTIPVGPVLDFQELREMGLPDELHGAARYVVGDLAVAAGFGSSRFCRLQPTTTVPESTFFTMKKTVKRASATPKLGIPRHRPYALRCLDIARYKSSWIFEAVIDCIGSGAGGFTEALVMDAGLGLCVV